MANKITVTLAVLTFAYLANLDYVMCNPAIATGYGPLEICIENCALCKRMLGSWFEGPLCAEACIKLKGKRIPDCEDLSSIAEFIRYKATTLMD